MCGYFCIGFVNFMLKGETLTEFTNLFSPNNFKKNYDIILRKCLNMAECNSIKHNFHKTPNMYLNLSANISNDQKFRRKKIIKLKITLLLRLKKEN